MKIKKLFSSFPECLIRGSKEVDITGITAHSNGVAPGFLFIAKKGKSLDGNEFILKATQAGAVAVLAPLYNPYLPQITQVIHPEPEKIEGHLAKIFFDDPSQALFLTGITGTNGKTTTSYLIKHLLDEGENRCGLIGTIEWVVGPSVFPATHTTPDVITNHKLLRDMVTRQCRACVMEVSSHALDQGRVAGLKYDAVVFTNLTQDHLDYHHDMEAYAAAKAKLFEQKSEGKSRLAILNADCPWHQRMLQKASNPILTYGIDAACDLKAQAIALSPKGTLFTVRYNHIDYKFEIPLIGRFNVYNALAAIGVGLVRGIPMEQICARLATFSQVPGRLERVSNSKGLLIFVDYAHTEDALENVLKTLKELTRGRLIAVFGCGGNRDTAKRPKMGAVVERLADVAIVTSDNPRHEDPYEIIQQILQGFSNPTRAIVLADRALAIQAAIGLATAQDLILIAGKGHETHQILSHQTLSFDDREVAAASCLYHSRSRSANLPASGSH